MGWNQRLARSVSHMQAAKDKMMDGRVEPRATDGDIEGLDDSQRAEVHAYEGGGPSDGEVLTDLTRDRGEDFVEDEQPTELLNAELDVAGMSIISAEDLADGIRDDDDDTDDLEGEEFGDEP
jgi:DNA-directed RNA polymerase subunit delta